MRLVPNLTALLACGVLPLSTAVSQAARVLPGSRVRVETDRQYVGMVLNADSRRLVLRLDGEPDTVTIPETEIRRLAVFAGRHSHAERGAVIGTAIGAVLGLAAGIGSQCSVNHGWFCTGPEAIPLGLLGGAFVGMIPGALIGSLSHGDRWESVPLDRIQVGLMTSPAGKSLGLGISIGF